ncbi:putative YphP/YqiW family bacilliredoxin [Chitinophaga dinghuensis]|uniref:Putative YphP/YqiW family bacilliredoxin n=1 Tax=Chitinophaga dinghuensis TaxID=1539050 RepID=A0A327WDD2_9BACT|nr:BrxA/BrxB family bacilliredoxin [Chitinophaga dinghuensis]RAJ87922.1 putative YphP/YqiW family bacilliredoxin [Chitinophaga dinghuensis]
MPYSPLLIKPFKDEIVDAGVKELLTAADVDKVMALNGTTLVVVNSVCGCAAGVARPAIRKLMEDDSVKKPDRIVTVFAGQDLEATAKFRSYIPDIPPSSPSIALFKDKEIVYFLPKFRIESRDANAVYNDIVSALEELVAG